LIYRRALSEALNRLHAVVCVTAHEEEEAPRGRRKRKAAAMEVEAVDLDELLLPVEPLVTDEESMRNVVAVNEITLADTLDYAAPPPTFDNFDAPPPNANVCWPPSFVFPFAIVPNTSCCRTRPRRTTSTRCRDRVRTRACSTPATR